MAYGKRLKVKECIIAQGESFVSLSCARVSMANSTSAMQRSVCFMYEVLCMMIIIEVTATLFFNA